MPELTAVMRGVIRTNIDLVIGGIGQVPDGLSVGSTGATENWFLVGQNGGTDNGPYTVTPLGVWTRHTEMNESAEFTYNKKIVVQFGTTYGNSEWYYAGVDNPTLGTTLLDFKLRSFEVPREAGMGLEDNAPFIQLPERAGVAGFWINPIVTFTDRGIAEGVTSGVASQTTLIEAMKTVYLSANSVRVEAGAIFVPGVGILEFDNAVDKTSLVLTANTWYYLYAYSSDGLPAIEVSSVAPDVPYKGSARSKTGDASRRYVPNSAFYASAANTIRRFTHIGNHTRWIADQNSALRVLSTATNTTSAAVDISAFCPPTADAVHVFGFVHNTDNQSVLYISAAGDGLQTIGVNSAAGQLASPATVAVSASRQVAVGRVALFGQRTLHHQQSAIGASRAHHIDLTGYDEAR